jgi:hypothetical protein
MLIKTASKGRAPHVDNFGVGTVKGLSVGLTECCEFLAVEGVCTPW